MNMVLSYARTKTLVVELHSTLLNISTTPTGLFDEKFKVDSETLVSG